MGSDTVAGWIISPVSASTQTGGQSPCRTALQSVDCQNALLPPTARTQLRLYDEPSSILQPAQDPTCTFAIKTPSAISTD